MNNMSEESEIVYKNLIFKINKELNYVEVVIDEVNFSIQESYIPAVSFMLEFALTIHPKYIIFNREKHKFTIASKLFPFTSNNIISPLKLDGVKKIITIGTVDEYQRRYREIEKIEPFIKWAETKQSAIEWIKKNEESTSNS